MKERFQRKSRLFFCTEIKFVAAVLGMQSLVSAGIVTFDSFLPWIMFLVIFETFLENWVWDRKNRITGIIFGILLAGMTAGTSEKSFLWIGTAGIGGFLLAKAVMVLAENWMKYAKKVKILAVVFAGIIGIGLMAEGYLKLPESVGGGISSGLALVLIYLVVCQEFGRFFDGQYKKEGGVTAAAAFLFACFSASGHLSVYERNPSIAWLLFGFLMVGWFVLFYIGLNRFCSIVRQIRLTDSGKRKKVAIWGMGIFSFVVAMLAFFPYFLTFYPGVMVFDAWNQMMQVLGMPYSNHHPWVHTMIMKLFWEVGIALFHSENRAVALYVCFSMSSIALAVACMISYLYARGIRVRYLVALLLAYVLSPINGMYAINMWKDTPHGAVCLIFGVLLAMLYDDLRAGRNRKLFWFLFVPVSFLVCFMRSNGLYAYILLIPFLLYTFRRQMKSVAAAVICVIVLAVVYKGPVFDYFEVKEPDIIESLSIPAQQIAAVIAYDGQMNEEEKQMVGEIIDISEVSDAYLGSVHCSDSIKDLVREKDNQQFISENKAEFFKLWLKLGWKNKYMYWKAFVDETEGYWYYRITYPFIWFTYVNENGSGINRESKVPAAVEAQVREMLEAYEGHFWRYYGSSFFIYLLLFTAIAALRRKKGIFMYVLSVGLWGTLLIATPVYADFRYIYGIFLCVPFLVLWEIMESRSEPEKECVEGRPGM